MQSNLTDFIPTGRTSLVKKGNISLQVQTEYAFRPYPRLTTTISNNGQVLHKIEKKLERPIESFDERTCMEEVMKTQHNEVVAVIREDSYRKVVTPDPEFAANEGAAPVVEMKISDRIKEVPGVLYLFQLDAYGRFTNEVSGHQFKKSFGAIFKNLRELVELFTLVPDSAVTRKKGVYVVETGRLYMLSCGDEFYFVLLNNPDKNTDYEAAFKSILDTYLP